MKSFLFILFSFLTCFCADAQTDTAVPKIVRDTGKQVSATEASRHPRKKVVNSASKRNTDTLKLSDSVVNTNTPLPVAPDSIVKEVRLAVIEKKPFDSFYAKLLDNPFLKTTAKPIYLVINERQRHDKDEMFYLLVGLLFLLAFIKLVFSRYFANMFRLFFQPSFRQKQTREQLAQSNLPSLLLNLFFILSGATYISFLLRYYNVVHIQFWLLLLYSSAALLVLYVGKFTLLSFAGWVFNVKEAAQTYIFSVSLVNKIIGVILVPFTLIIAFSQPAIINWSITISLLLILILFIYRYLLSFAPVRKDVKVSVFHFFIYIMAFEITPLLLIYKTLIIFLNNSC